jgi:proline iminopeptidase
LGPLPQPRGENDYVCTGTLRSWTRLADLDHIACPALVIHGERDEFTPADAARLVAPLSNGRLAVLPECSHTPFFDQPEAYFVAVVAFLRAHPITDR